jgi:hypothetical protein
LCSSHPPFVGTATPVKHLGLARCRAEGMRGVGCGCDTARHQTTKAPQSASVPVGPTEQNPPSQKPRVALVKPHESLPIISCFISHEKGASRQRFGAQDVQIQRSAVGAAASPSFTHHHAAS